MKRRNIFKTVLSLTLALIMVLGVAPFNKLQTSVDAGGGSPDMTVSGDYTYYMCAQKKICLVKAKISSDGTLSIPATVDDFEVMEMSPYYMDTSTVKSYEVSEKNKYLSSEEGVLFNKDKTMLIAYPSARTESSYVVPDSVKTIDYSSFSNKYLKSITLGNSVEEVHNLEDCINLESVTVNSKNKNFAFSDGVLYNKNKTSIIWVASYVTSLVIPDSVTSGLSISSSAIKNLKIGAGIEDIYCIDCPNLESVTVSGNSKSFVVEDGILYTKDKKTLVKYPSKKAGSVFEIPSGVTVIDAYAFKNCKNLSGLQLSETIKEIRESAFENCTGLKKITFPGSTDQHLKEHLFDDEHYCMYVDNYAFANCTGLTDVVFLDRLAEFSYSAFENCTGIKRITFNGCSSNEIEDPTDSDLRRSTTTENFNGFFTVLSQICAQANVESISINGADVDYATDGGAFYNADKTELLVYLERETTKTVALPENVTAIGDSAFAGFVNLNSVTFPSKLTSIGDGAFKGCVSLKKISFPSELVSIGNNAFGDCVALDKISLPSGLSKIGSRAFMGCRALSEISVPNELAYLKNVGSDVLTDTAYYSDKKNWNDSILSIGNCIFDIDDDFSGKLNIKEGTLCMADSALYGCTKITEIYIPASLENLSSAMSYIRFIKASVNPFISCLSLKAINVDESNEKYASDRGVLYDKDMTRLLHFPQNSSLRSYTIPDGVAVFLLNSAVVFEGGSTSLLSGLLASMVQSMFVASLDCDLSSITIPDSVEYFWICNGGESLKSVLVSPSNKTYSSDDGVLFNKDKTKLVLYPNAKTDSSYTVPESVISADFGACPNLKKLTVGANVSSLKITDCESIEQILVSDKNKTYLSTDKGLYEKDYEDVWNEVHGMALVKCMTDTTDFVIADGTAIIKYGAFKNCVKLKSVSILTDVDKIEENQFNDFNNLPELRYSGTEAQWESVNKTGYNEELLKCNIVYNYEFKNLVEPTSIKLNKSKKTLEIGETYTLKATVKPKDTTDASVVWTSSDENVATVDENGVVTAVSVGTATITATASNGLTAESVITVEEKSASALSVIGSVLLAPVNLIVGLFKLIAGIFE